MTDRVTILEAARMLDIGKSTVCMAAENLGWESTYEGEGRHKKRMFLRSEIEAFAADRKRFNTPVKFDRASKSDEIRGHVEWADGLNKWPSDEEIDARTSDVYRRKDLESVLDTRVFRFNDPRKALRKPAMRVMNHRGERYL